MGVGRVTNTTQTVRVLLVGKRARILDELGRALRDEGLSVREETDVDRARQSIGQGAGGAAVDVLALGRAVNAAKRDDLVMTMRAANPRVKIVDGMAPIAPLLIAQIHEALDTPPPGARIVEGAVYEPSDNRFVVALRRPATVEVTLHRLDPLYRAIEIEIYRGPLGRGRQHLPILRRIGRGELFLVVRADSETTVHKLN